MEISITGVHSNQTESVEANADGASTGGDGAQRTVPGKARPGAINRIRNRSLSHSLSSPPCYRRLGVGDQTLNQPPKITWTNKPYQDIPNQRVSADRMAGDLYNSLQANLCPLLQTKLSSQNDLRNQRAIRARREQEALQWDLLDQQFRQRAQERAHAVRTMQARTEVDTDLRSGARSSADAKQVNSSEDTDKLSTCDGGEPRRQAEEGGASTQQSLRASQEN